NCCWAKAADPHATAREIPRPAASDFIGVGLLIRSVLSLAASYGLTGVVPPAAAWCPHPVAVAARPPGRRRHMPQGRARQSRAQSRRSPCENPPLSGWQLVRSNAPPSRDL